MATFCVFFIYQSIDIRDFKSMAAPSGLHGPARSMGYCNRVHFFFTLHRYLPPQQICMPTTSVRSAHDCYGRVCQCTIFEELCPLSCRHVLLTTWSSAPDSECHNQEEVPCALEVWGVAGHKVV